VAELGKGARGATSQDAAEAGELVVVGVSTKPCRDLPAEQLAAARPHEPMQRAAGFAAPRLR
jgi:hypothetical protein